MKQVLQEEVDLSSKQSIGQNNFGIYSDTTDKHAESNNTNAPYTNNTNFQKGQWFNMASPPTGHTFPVSDGMHHFPLGPSTCGLRYCANL